MSAVSRPQASLVRRLEAVPLRRRLVAIVGVLVGASLVVTSVVTAYLMFVNLTGRVDAELRSVARPVAAQAFDDLRTRDTTFPSNYAFELQSQFGTVLRLPTGQTSTPDLPDLEVDGGIWLHPTMPSFRVAICDPPRSLVLSCVPCKRVWVCMSRGSCEKSMCRMSDSVLYSLFLHCT